MMTFDPQRVCSDSEYQWCFLQSALSLLGHASLVISHLPKCRRQHLEGVGNVYDDDDEDLNVNSR